VTQEDNDDGVTVTRSTTDAITMENSKVKISDAIIDSHLEVSGNLDVTGITTLNDKVGIGKTDPSGMLDVSGGIIIGDNDIDNIPGAIRFTGTDFEGNIYFL